MEFILSVSDFTTDTASQIIWKALQDELKDRDGICYYQHPVIGGGIKSTTPDISVLAQDYQPIIFRCLNWPLDQIHKVSDQQWIVNGEHIDSPLQQLDDLIYALDAKLSRERRLRRRLKPVAVLAFPSISQLQMKGRLPELLRKAKEQGVTLIWSDSPIKETMLKVEEPLDAFDWKLAKSVFQSTTPLNRPTGTGEESKKTLGGAVRQLENEIALLDSDQHRATVQIAPGPQRIRGLAGTGKTILLAMKAANIHQRYPEATILFTFNTQSLYNQIRGLITRFYRTNNDVDPNWDKVQIRHAWGGANKPGVYSDVCRRHGIKPLTFSMAQFQDAERPFRAACKHAMSVKIHPEYDYILIDEAQDFATEFFQMLFKLSNPPNRIYWAYDELQSLSHMEMPSPSELFGTNEKGAPNVDLSGEEYPGGIEKDLVLRRSYRCPQEVLMLAHGIGLGIHSPRGCVQMLSNPDSWKAVGYTAPNPLKPGQPAVICRPPESSSNHIAQIYKGKQPLISHSTFNTREEEFEFVSKSITNDIKNEGMAPHQIVVVSLNSRPARSYLTAIQARLSNEGIGSTIPGLVDDATEFAMEGMVTLSTVYRVKGNEAPVVYIISFDSLYDYIDELENRNRAFTSISRSKGWVRITGIGEGMTKASKEISAILADIPCFKFTFPDMDKIRKLDASETLRRRKEVRETDHLLGGLLNANPDALSSLDPIRLAKLDELLKKIRKDK